MHGCTVRCGGNPDAISELTKGRLLAGDTRVKIAASEDVALRKAFAAEGASGFWQQILKEQEKIDPEIREFDEPQIYARLGEKRRHSKVWLATMNNEELSGRS